MVSTAPLTHEVPTATSEALSARLNSHHNAFGLLRLVFATFVIISHAFPIGGFGDDPLQRWTREETDLGTIGLLGFFAISGYLIAVSAQHHDTYGYVWRRFLRIYPGFVMVLLITALVIGPVFYWLSHGSAAGYWSTAPDGPLSYLTANARILIQQYGIHDLFATDAFGRPSETSVVNGSLWTLWYEAGCYLFLGFVSLFGAFHHRRWIIAGAAATAFIISSPLVHAPILPDAITGLLTRQADGIQLFATFLVGATFRVYGHRFRLRTSWALSSALIVIVSIFTSLFVTVGYIFFVYLVLWLAARLPEQTYRIGQRTDISYGLYIYAWPLQAALFALGAASWGYLPYLAITGLVLTPIAWLSWRLVERPAQRLRGLLPAQPAAPQLAGTKMSARSWQYYLPRLGVLAFVAIFLVW